MTRPVIFIGESAQVGGGEINLLTIAKGLKERSYPFQILLAESGPLEALLKESQFPYRILHRPPLFSVSFYIRHRWKIPNPFVLLVNSLLGLIWTYQLFRFLEQRKNTIVQTTSMWAHAFAGLAAKIAGLPVIWHFQDIVDSQSGWGLYHGLVKFWAQHIPDRIICISDSVAEQFLNDPLLSKKIIIIWNTIDTIKYQSPSSITSKALILNEEKPPPRIGTVSRLTPWKGIDIVLQSAKILHQRGISFEWLIAGEEAVGIKGYQQQLDRQIQDWNLTKHVRFVGWVSDMPVFYRSLDILVHLPIEPEPFGLVLLEAMTAGVPVITTANGGAAKLVTTGGGLVVPPDKAEPVAEAISTWLQNPDLRHEKGRISAQYVSANFSLLQYIEQLTSLYATFPCR